jgi:hypothetical protein
MCSQWNTGRRESKKKIVPGTPLGQAKQAADSISELEAAVAPKEHTICLKLIPGTFAVYTAEINLQGWIFLTLRSWV